MKIVSLKVKNIASLKGEHFIDFDSILNHSGVFAITGETGSGKSTILNSISLALYGQHYKKSNKQLDFVTLGESNGEIELVYKISGQLYKAFWHLRLKKNDGQYLKNPQQERRFSKLINDKWETIEQFPEETLNLSFDQFTKTIVLNQGEFSKFLSSGFKDRKDILSKLYDGEKLEKLSIHVRRKITLIKADIDTVNAQITGINENTNFSLEDAQSLVKEDKIEVKEISNILSHLETSYKRLKELVLHKEQWLKNISHIEKLKEILKTLTTSSNSLKIKLKQSEERLKDSKLTFNKKEPLLIECISKQNILKQKENNLNNSEVQLLDICESIKKNKNHLDQLISQNKEFESNIAKIKDNNKFKPISINNVEKAQIANKKYVDLKNQIELYTNEVDIYKIDITKIAKKGDELKNEIQDFVDKNYEKRSIDLKNIYLKQKESLEIQKEALINIESYMARVKDINHEDISNQDLLKRNNGEINKLEQSITDIKSYNRELELAIKSFGLQEYINKVSKESLNQGHCLVCNSKDTEHISVSRDIDSNEHESLQVKYESQCNMLRTNEIKVQGLRSSQAHYRAIILKLKQEGQELSDSLLSKYDFITKDQLENKNISITSKIKDKIKIAENEILINEKELEEIQIHLNKQGHIEGQLKDLRADYQTKNLKLEDLEQKLLNTKVVKKTIASELESIFTEDIGNVDIELMINLNKDFHINEQRINDNSKATHNTNDQLKTLFKNEKNTGITIKELKESISDLKTYLKMNSDGNPEEELNKLRISLDTCQDELNIALRKLNESKIKIAEDTSKQKNYEEQCEQTDNLFKLISVELSEHTKNNGESKNSIKDKDTLNSFVDFFKKLNKSLSIDEVDLKVLNETILFNQNLENKLTEVQKQINHNIVKNDTLISQKLSAQGKVDKLDNEIKDLTKKKTELEDLYDLVGKDEFRNFVLSLIEKNLITQTNLELKNLCDDRYLIKHFSKNVQSMPDFYVIDKFKAGMTRKVSTLSGGETFMVSLAMALALAELTRGTSEVDSFFIDEGFGTLDDDSLEDVLDMINTMEQRGKSIGLISHIKKLTQRIGVNIQLEKSELGNSNIKVNFN